MTPAGGRAPLSGLREPGGPLTLPREQAPRSGHIQLPDAAEKRSRPGCGPVAERSRGRGRLKPGQRLRAAEALRRRESEAGGSLPLPAGSQARQQPADEPLAPASGPAEQRRAASWLIQQQEAVTSPWLQTTGLTGVPPQFSPASPSLLDDRPQDSHARACVCVFRGRRGRSFLPHDEWQHQRLQSPEWKGQRGPR